MIFEKQTELSATNLNRLIAGDGVVQGLRVFAGNISITDGKVKCLGPSIHGLSVKAVDEGVARIRIKDAGTIADANTTVVSASGAYIKDGDIFCYVGSFIIVTSA